MDGSLGKELNRVSHRIHRQIDRQVRRMDLDEASRSNLWIIGYIYDHREQDVFQKDLEGDLCISRSTVSKVVDLMIQKGMVRREPVAYDARLKKLILTEKALQIHHQMELSTQKFERRLRRGFSEKDLEQLQEYLRRLEKNMEDIEKSKEEESL